VIVFPAASYVDPDFVTFMTVTVYVPLALTVRLNVATPDEFVFAVMV
jgi:hypothetical protein